MNKDYTEHDRIVQAFRDVNNEKATQETINAIEEETRREPNNAEAWAALSAAQFQVAMSLPEHKQLASAALLERASEASDKALAVDPKCQSAMRHGALIAYFWNQDKNRARRLAKQALEANPHDAKMKWLLEKVGTGGGCAGVLLIVLASLFVLGWMLNG